MLLALLLAQGQRAPPLLLIKYVFLQSTGKLLFQSFFNRPNQHLAALLRTSDSLRMTGREGAPVGLVERLIHRLSIRYRTRYVKTICSSRSTSLIPIAQAQGLSGAEFVKVE